MQDLLMKYFHSKDLDLEGRIVYLCRHGQTESNKDRMVQGHLDSPLSEFGIEQANKLGQYFIEKSIKVEKIISSSLGRARRTAEIVSEYTHLDIESLDWLKEVNMGTCQGRSKDTLFQEYKSWFEKRKDPIVKVFSQFPEGESYFDVYLRVVKPLLELVTKQKKLIIVGHDMINKIIRAILTDTELEQEVMINQKNNEICKIDLEKGEYIKIEV